MRPVSLSGVCHISWQNLFIQLFRRRSKERKHSGKAKAKADVSSINAKKKMAENNAKCVKQILEIKSILFYTFQLVLVHVVVAHTHSLACSKKEKAAGKYHNMKEVVKQIVSDSFLMMMLNKLSNEFYISFYISITCQKMYF